MNDAPQPDKFACWQCGRRFGECDGALADIILGKQPIAGELRIKCQRCNAPNIFPRREKVAVS